MSTGFKCVLAGDTGTKSFTLARVRIRGQQAKVEFSSPFSGVLSNLKDRIDRDRSMVKGKPIFTELAPFNEQLPGFMEAVRVCIASHAPDLIVLERFQARGGKGPVIEQVSMMNMGWAIAASNAGVRIRLITAGEWKMAMRRLDPDLLDTLYNEAKALKIQPHQIDSVCIGLYGGLKDPFSCWTKNRRRMLTQIRRAMPRMD